jgi:hypothetical protein
LNQLALVVQTKMKEIDEKMANVMVFKETKFQIELIKKNAKFHAKMKWHDLLLEDLFALISIQSELHYMEAQ